MELPTFSEMTDFKAVGRIFARMVTDIRGVADESATSGRVEGIKPISFLALILSIFFVGEVAVNTVRSVHWSVSASDEMWDENEELLFLFNIAPNEVFGATLAEMWTPGDSVMSQKIEAAVGSQGADDVARYLVDHGETEAAETIDRAVDGERKMQYGFTALMTILAPLSAWLYAFLGRKIAGAPDELAVSALTEPLLVWTGFWTSVCALPAWLTLLAPTSEAVSAFYLVVTIVTIGAGFYQYHLILDRLCGSELKRNLLAYAATSALVVGGFAVLGGTVAALVA